MQNKRFLQVVINVREQLNGLASPDVEAMKIKFNDSLELCVQSLVKCFNLIADDMVASAKDLLDKVMVGLLDVVDQKLEGVVTDQQMKDLYSKVVLSKPSQEY